MPRMSPESPLLLPRNGETDPERYRASQKVTWVSIVVNVVLALIQIVVGIMAHAQSLVADGFHSLSDLIADLMVLMANYHSRHPADKSHPYGHHRIETAASLGLGVILAGTGTAILWSAAVRLQHLDELPAVAPMALWTALATLAAKEGLFHYMLAVAERLRSPMLVANAWHARSDAASSLVVAAGIGGSMAGYRFLDPLAAILVGFMILRMGTKFTYQAMQELIDTALSDDEVERIRQTLRETPGVVGLHELRTRRMAHQVLADAHIQVDARISVSEGHRIAEMARNRALANHPEVLDMLVHVDAEEDLESEKSQQIAPLPERAVLVEHLRSLLNAALPGSTEDSGNTRFPPFPPFERVLLHYLGGRVEAEVFLSADASGTPDIRQAIDRVHFSLKDDPYFTALQFHFHLGAAPKQGKAKG